jgi:hypothetical protein
MFTGLLSINGRGANHRKQLSSIAASVYVAGDIATAAVYRVTD